MPPFAKSSNTTPWFDAAESMFMSSNRWPEGVAKNAAIEAPAAGPPVTVAAVTATLAETDFKTERTETKSLTSLVQFFSYKGGVD